MITSFQQRQRSAEEFTEMFLSKANSHIDCGSWCSQKMNHHNCTSFHFDEDLLKCHCGEMQPYPVVVITDPMIVHVNTLCPGLYLYEYVW